MFKKIMLSLKNFIINEAKSKKEEEKQEGMTILDNVLNNQENDNKEDIKKFVEDFIRPNGPTIYAFVTDKVKDAIKIGYTDQQPEKRIQQWKEIYGKEKGEVECLGWWSSEEFTNAQERVFFWDHAIHKKVSDRGYENIKGETVDGKSRFFMNDLTDKGQKVVDLHYSKEFFRKYKRLLNGELDSEDKEELSKELIEDIINQMKLNIKNGTQDFKVYSFDEEGKTTNKEANKIWPSPAGYSNTDLQEECVENGVEAIKNGKKNILMAAVMRFGKTHASYDIIKRSGLKRVVVCSAKPDVRKSWRDDINHKSFYKDFVFIEIINANECYMTYCKDDRLVTEKGKANYDSLEQSGKTLIFFFSLHDLAGSINTIKEKHKEVFSKEFDLMVVDETHYGSHANSFGEATKLRRKEIGEDDNTDIEEEQKINKQATEDMKKLDIKYKTVLQVSGTPYYILASNEMIDDDAEIICKVSYSDMLTARDKWTEEHPKEDPSNSPYFGIPTLHKIGLKLNKQCRDVIAKSDMTGSLNELFKVKGNTFAYEDAVKSLMKSIFGNGKSDSLAFLKNKTVEGNKVCKHTLIVLPMKNACDAMHRLLETIIDTKERAILQVTGNNTSLVNASSIKELNDKLSELDNNGKKSIILTVNRFLTGVSMPLVDSMIYLKNATSPQEYDQNIFRLCTRNVKSVKSDGEFKNKKINMKENVYLIDFNMTNMFNMIANSAKMKAAAEGNPTTKRIKELMKQDLKATPIFCEDAGRDEIVGKMHKITSRDMMEIYTGYNKNKSISDIVNDEINLFGKLFDNKEFQKAIEEIDIDADKSKIDLDNVNVGDDELQGFNVDKSIKKGSERLTDFVTKNEKDDNSTKMAKITKEKFKAITKNLLYCNICLDEPCKDVESIIDKSKEDDKFRKMLNEFKISVKELKKVYSLMDSNFKIAYNTLLARMSMLAQDESEKGYDKFSKALKGLGRLAKNEVVTPKEIVDKMIDKLSKEDYMKADSILLVNEKQAEFLTGLYNKFGKDIIKKCKIVASSEIGKHLCRKMLKSIGIKDTENTILNIEDVDGNGYYDVNDFLEMNNKEILDMNKGKHFDICLMNPPYDNKLHEKFLMKVLDISNNGVSIQPAVWINKANKNRKTFKNIINKCQGRISDIEIIPHQEINKLFGTGNSLQDGGIFTWNIVGDLDLNSFGYKNKLEQSLYEKVNIDNNDEMTLVRADKKYKYVDPKTYKKQPNEVPIYQWHGGENCYDAVIVPEELYYKKAKLVLIFNNEIEANNFKESLKTKFANWFYDHFVRPGDGKILTYMFRMKDYSKPWTDERFYNYFNLTKEEINIIKNYEKN